MEEVKINLIRPFIRSLLETPMLCFKVRLCHPQQRDTALTDVGPVLKKLVEETPGCKMTVKKVNPANACDSIKIIPMDEYFVLLTETESGSCINEKLVEPEVPQEPEEKAVEVVHDEPLLREDMPKTLSSEEGGLITVS